MRIVQILTLCLYQRTTYAQMFECLCLNGTRDTSCAEINACASNPCINGVCIPDTQYGTYQCGCLSGYTGDNCNTSVPARLCGHSENNYGSLCNNNSLCTKFTPGYAECTCHPGYSSDLDVVNCNKTSYPCETPETDEGGYTLNNGSNCMDINECASLPCQNGGTCNNMLAHYTCSCAESGRYSGARCEVDRIECNNSVQCQAGSTCVITIVEQAQSTIDNQSPSDAVIFLIGIGSFLFLRCVKSRAVQGTNRRRP